MTRSERIEAAALAFVDRWQAVSGFAHEVGMFERALALPADPVPSVTERERALVREAHGRACRGPDGLPAVLDALDVASIIAAVDATHPRQAAPGESVREWAYTRADVLAFGKNVGDWLRAEAEAFDDPYRIQAVHRVADRLSVLLRSDLGSLLADRIEREHGGGGR